MGGQPGSPQAISDTIMVSSSPSAKRACVHSRTRSSASARSGLLLLMRSMTLYRHARPLCRGSTTYYFSKRDQDLLVEQDLVGRDKPGHDASKGRCSGGKSAGGGADRAEQDRD